MPEISTPKKNIGGIPELSSLVKETRKNNVNTMFLHGGDSLTPSLMSSFDQGSHMVDVLNILEPEAMSISERELAYKEDELILRTAEAGFPFLSSNSIDSLTGAPLEGVEEYQCFTYDSHKVCVISVLDPEVATHYLINRLKVLDSKKRILELSKLLKINGSDLLILFTAHNIQGIEELVKNGTVDIVLHADLEEDSTKKIGEGLYVKQGTNKGKAAKISVELSGHNQTLTKKISGQILTLNNYPKDPAVQIKTAYYNDKLAQIMNVVIGTTLTPMEISRIGVRTEENSFGNLAADAIRNYFNTDIAVINGGSIRANVKYAAGTKLTRRDIQTLMPFQAKGAMVSIVGKELLSALENSVSMTEKADGRFLHLSGLEISYCPQNNPGQRIYSVLIAGKPLDVKKKYTLATDEYLTSGGDDYKTIKNAEKISTKHNQLNIWEIVRLHIEQNKEVSPKIEGRISKNCN